ncbi:MAG: hypothetical protein ACRD09_03945, partial [Vicinamibacterales bacterium]
MTILLVATLAVAPPAQARQAPEPAPQSVRLEAREAGETRDALHRTLAQYPPSLAHVLRLDPSLLTNQSYLATYPTLAAFLAQHPEVAHNPAYFLGDLRGGFSDPKRDLLNFWEQTLAGIAILTGVAIVTSLFVWLIKTVIDYRRWLRLTKIQTDAHNKLLDRLTANEELLAYVQSPAGQRFLESAPIAMDAGPRAISAPVGRILWSLQAGFVLALGGIGLQFASSRVMDEVQLPLWVMGVLAVALGGGFLLSAVVAFALSRRLGLFEPLHA